MSAYDLLRGKSVERVPVQIKASYDVTEVRDEIRDLLAQGLGKRAISKKLGMSERAVYRHIDVINMQDLRTQLDIVEKCSQHNPKILDLLKQAKKELNL